MQRINTNVDAGSIFKVGGVVTFSRYPTFVLIRDLFQRIRSDEKYAMFLLLRAIYKLCLQILKGNGVNMFYIFKHLFSLFFVKIPVTGNCKR